MEAILESPQIRIKEIGRVVEVKKTIAKVRGLSNFMNGQLVIFASGTKGMVVGFSAAEVLVLILGDEASVRRGQEVKSIQEVFKIPVGENLLGRVVNALGEPADGKPAIKEDDFLFIFSDAPDTMDRQDADRPLETGTKFIDAVIPISRGQRELIIGDRMTGKTTIGIDAILNQRKTGVICIYCCIGKSFSSLIKVVQLLKSKSALDYTIIVSASASSTVGEQYLAPYSASAMGEYFMRQGKDVLVIFDDLTKHAWAYRQISLLLERPPGREAYPGDIYYVHSQLIERAGRLNKELGGGSMTFLPIVDTLQGDVTGFIPSNLISMTDGQIFLNANLFAEGFKPAVDLSLSVSIMGSRTQNPILNKLTGSIRMDYIQYKELARLTKLKSSLPVQAERKIRRGEALITLLMQDKNYPVGNTELIMLLYALDRRIFDDVDLPGMRKFKEEILSFAKKNDPGLVAKLDLAQDLSPDLKSAIDKVFIDFFKEIKPHADSAEVKK